MTENFWLGLGFLAQGLFFSRFFVQWLASEKAGRSVMPDTFWFLSIAGSMLLLAYSIYRWDWVFMVGQSSGVLIYSRNIWLRRRERLDASTI